MKNNELIPLKERCAQFRRDLKSINYYRLRLIEIQDELEEIAVRMQGVSSPSGKSIYVENKNPYASNFLELLDIEQKLIVERQFLNNQIKSIEDKINCLPDEIKLICEELYLEGKNAEMVAIDNGYGHKKVMYRAINREFEKIL